MSSNTCDPLSTANATPKPSARLTNPTTYHLQQQQEYQYQMRFKDQVGVDPTQVMEHQHLFFAQHQQENSPNLSDLDYSDLTANTSSSGNGLTSSDTHRQSQPPPAALQHHHHFIRQHHQPSSVVDPSSTTMAPPPSSGTNSNSPDKDLQLEEYKLQHPPAHYSHSMMYYPPSSTTAMNSQSYYYKQTHPGGAVNGATASTSFGASAPAHLGYNHMHPPPLVGHSVTPNDAATMAMAAPAPPDNMVTGINRQHQQPHVYEQHKQQQQSDTSSGMDAGEINEPYEDDFAAQAK